LGALEGRDCVGCAAVNVLILVRNEVITYQRLLGLTIINIIIGEKIASPVNHVTSVLSEGQNSLKEVMI
jgi:hypothetical protein